MSGKGQLPSSFRQPHSVHSPPGSPYPAHITSSQSPSSLSPSITPSRPYTPDLKPSMSQSQIVFSVVVLQSFWCRLYCIHRSWTQSRFT